MAGRACAMLPEVNYSAHAFVRERWVQTCSVREQKSGSGSCLRWEGRGGGGRDRGEKPRGGGREEVVLK